jgi:starch phosphorylase
MPEFEGKVVFIENYDIDVARHLYHGVDVWLNNPTRPLEASGTSGEKVCPNGVVNFSVLDGWWAEAWRRRENGWAIGEIVTSTDPDIQSSFDAESIYSLLENEIAPLFYRRENGIPHEWIAWMKNSIISVSPQYSSSRQVREYTEIYYRPSSHKGHLFEQNDFASAKELAAWKAKIRECWHNVKIKDVQIEKLPTQGIRVGQHFHISAVVDAGKLEMQDILVEAYAATPDGRAEITVLNLDSQGRHSGNIAISESGQYDLNIRVIPTHPMLVQKHEMRLITWAA